MIIRKN